uniref:Uncharacterized protein n=1 Tax=Anopheles atroparvus TaxID=41427 RepID=A0A182IKU4_ANOAO
MFHEPNLRVQVVHVRGEPHLLVNRAIERIAEGQRVDVARTGTDAAVQRVVVALVERDRWRVVRRNDEVELERHAALLALRQHQAGREATVRLGHVERELTLAVVRIHDPLVQLVVVRAVLHGHREFRRLARERIVALQEVVLEHVQQHKVLTILVHAVHVSVLIVLGSEVHAHNTLDVLVGVDRVLDAERSVVEAPLARQDHKVRALVVREPAELRQLGGLHRLLVEHLDVDGVGDIGVVLFEERHQLGHLDLVHLQLAKVQLLLGVRRQVVLELPVPLDESLVQLVEHRVAHRRLEVLEHARQHLVVLEVLHRSAEQDAREPTDVLVEPSVHTVRIGLDQVAQVLHRLRLGQIDVAPVGQHDVAQIDRLADPVLVLNHLLDVLVVVGRVHLVVVVARREADPVVVVHVRVVPGGDRFVPRELRDRAEVVRQALQVVAGQELLVLVQVELAAAILVQAVLLAAHPERVVGVEVVVVRVQPDVLGEVGHLLLDVRVHVPAGVVGRNDDGVPVVDLLHAGETLHLVLGRLLDHLRVEEVVRVDLVRRRQLEACHILAVQHRHGDGVHEHTLVDVEARPNDRLVERLPVLGVVEQVEQCHRLLAVVIVQHAEDFIERQQAVLVQRDELLHCLDVLVVLVVLLDVVLLRHLPQFGVHFVLVHVLEHVQQLLLLHQEVLIGLGYLVLRHDHVACGKGR